MIKYIDFALTVPLKNAIAKAEEQLVGQPEKVRESYFNGMTDRVKLIHNHDLDIHPAIAFINKRAEVFARLTPYEHMLDSVICDGGDSDGLYFPEIRDYVNQINPELTETEYQSAFDFWQQYQYHLKARDHISTLSKLLGITGASIRDGGYDSWGCAGFKGSPGNSEEINHLIKVVEKHTNYLGFTPWVTPMIGYKAEPAYLFAANGEIDEMEFFLSTNIGTIYPYSKPKVKTEFSSHLKTVK